MLLIDIFKKYVMNESNESLFNSTEDFMDDYIIDAQNIDYEIVRLYGQRDFYNPFEDTVDTYVYWKKCWDAFIHRRKNMFQKAWDNLNKEYDFDSNYSRHSTVKNTHSGNVDTNYLGTEKVHMTNGEGIVDTIHSEVPFDKSDFKNISKDVSTTHERISDSNLSYENRQDKVTESKNDDVIEDTYGNTGIYSPTNLLENEYVFRIKTDFYIDVISQFINEVTIYL